MFLSSDNEGNREDIFERQRLSRLRLLTLMSTNSEILTRDIWKGRIDKGCTYGNGLGSPCYQCCSLLRLFTPAQLRSGELTSKCRRYNGIVFRMFSLSVVPFVSSETIGSLTRIVVDHFTMDIIARMVTRNTLRRLYPWLDTYPEASFICGYVGTLVRPISLSLDIVHRYSADRRVIYGLFLQLGAQLRKLRSVKACLYSASLRLIDRSCSYRCDGIEVRCPITLLLDDLGNASVMVDSTLVIPRKIVMNNSMDYGKYYRYSSEYVAAYEFGRRSGTDPSKGSLDFYVLGAKLLTSLAALAIEDTLLLQLWSSLFVEDQGVEFVRSRLIRPDITYESLLSDMTLSVDVLTLLWDKTNSN